MGKGEHLGEFERWVMMAVIRLRENAYGMRIRREIHEQMGRDTSIGSVYVTLDRLEQKGFVRSWDGEPTPERGGRAKRYFEVSAAGVRELEAFDRAYMAMRRGLSRRVAWAAS
jgi:PadR family transcriptional regulator, regulatory protein PadR